MRRKQQPNDKARVRQIAAYIRVSTQRQVTEGDSLEAQQSAIERYVEQKKQLDGWQVGSLTHYVDAGRSGKDMKRPELQKLRAAVQRGEVDVVVSFKLDRISRSVRDFLELWELFKHHEVELVILKENFDTSSHVGEFFILMLMGFAQLERKMTAERTQATMEDRARRGLWNGGYVYGYVSAPDDPGRLSVDPDWAPIIQAHFFDAFEELGSAGAVQRRLLELGIETKEDRSRSGAVKGGKPFEKQQVVRILRNPIYVGSIRWGEILRENCHESIISKEQFERVQRKLDETTRRRTNHRYSRGRQYLLRGLLRCRCGAMLTPKGATGRNRTHHYYECTRQIHQGGKAACDAPRIPAEALEDAIISRIRHLGLRKVDRDRIVQEALLHVDADAKRVAEEIQIVRQQTSQVQTEINNLVQVLKVMGESAVVSVQQELSQLEAKRTRLKEQQESLAEQEKPLSVVKSAARTFIESWHSVDELLDEGEPEEQRTILQHLIEVIELEATDEKGRQGRYAMRLFPEVCPPQDFEGGATVREPQDPSPPVMSNWVVESSDDPEVLTEDGVVRQNGEKAPRLGLEPRT